MKTLIFPIDNYKSKSWTMNAYTRRKIEAFEMSISRKMLSPMDCIYNELQILQKLDIKQQLVTTIDSQRLKLFVTSLEKTESKNT